MDCICRKVIFKLNTYQGGKQHWSKYPEIVEVRKYKIHLQGMVKYATSMEIMEIINIFHWEK